MKTKHVKTQKEFDKATEQGFKIIVDCGFFVAMGNSSVEARETQVLRLGKLKC